MNEVKKRKKPTDPYSRIGERFTMLVILKIYPKNGVSFAIALCDCGNKVDIPAYRIVNGNNLSCGCKSKIDFYERNKGKEKVLRGGMEITKSMYSAYHSALVRRNGKPHKCEHCGVVGKKRYEYALLKGRVYSSNIEDYIQLCCSCHRKYDLNPDVVKRIGDKLRGRKRPDISERQKGVQHPNEWVPISQYSKEGTFIKDHLSAYHASIDAGILRTSIMNNLAGRTRTSGGFVWKYKTPSIVYN